MQIPPPLRRQDLWSLSRDWNNYNIRKQFILWSGRSLIREQELTRKKGLWWVQYIYGLCASSNTVKYQSTCFPLWVWCKPYGPNGEGPNCLLLHFTLFTASYSWASHLHTSPSTNVRNVITVVWHCAVQCSGQDTNGYVDWTYLNWRAHECSNKVWCQWPILFQNQCPGVFQYLWASMFPFRFSLRDRQPHYTVLLPSCISLPSLTLVVFAVTLYMIFHGFYFFQGVHDGGNNSAAHKQASFLQ
jgi:hypothetical protein